MTKVMISSNLINLPEINSRNWYVEVVMLKPFTNLRHNYFQFLNCLIETFLISIRCGIIYVAIKFCCVIFHKQIAFAYDMHMQESGIPQIIFRKSLKLEPIFVFCFRLLK